MDTPICSICKKPVRLETAKTDENGKAVHENCYLQRLVASTEDNWHEIFKAAVLETDWTKMHERIQAAESAVRERQRVLSEDHRGTPQERIALADAITGLRVLRREASEWHRGSPE